MNRTIANGETEWAHNAEFDGLQHNGVSGHGFRDRQYGRRVEADHSWTVYHVFTGIPAHIDGAQLVGLTRARATQSMLDLNRRNAEDRRVGAMSAPGHPEMQGRRS
ncbi:hypothetical protein [Mesorhizobium sp. WSM3224]|jgi:hypothetical protein|uniref:hypothetical protein n=1 Tax=Mesorhizobium sp. WSM3224 TaxID=1040986 RepID=UPI00041E5861|nr:hypothetical protein [Mesorhizobium sp. WSM3224]